TIESDFGVGTQFEGTVEHKEAFGLFVNIAMGVTGLLPRSAWRDSTDHQQYENKRKGDKVKVRVERIDLDTRKLSFSIPRDDDDENWRGNAAVTTPKTASFGTLGDLLKGVKGK
ncbi:MAG: S1 RNA-binding domain-containing protein, partial [Bdellovibrionales bacterium]